jgi:hypothetical protein
MNAIYCKAKIKERLLVFEFNNEKRILISFPTTKMTDTVKMKYLCFGSYEIFLEGKF